MVATLIYLLFESKLKTNKTKNRQSAKKMIKTIEHALQSPALPSLRATVQGTKPWNGINNILISFGSTLSILGVSKYEQSLFHISCSSNHCTCKECKGREKKVFWWWEWWTQNQKSAKETILIMRCCTQKKVTSPVCRDTQREDDQRGGVLLWRRLAWNVTITFM